MNAATIARIAAWNAIADEELPAGTRVVVKDGAVTVSPRGAQPVHVPYGPADTPDSLCDALKNAIQANAQGGNRPATAPRPKKEH